MYASEQFSMNACMYVLRMCVCMHVYMLVGGQDLARIYACM